VWDYWCLTLGFWQLFVILLVQVVSEVCVALLLDEVHRRARLQNVQQLNDIGVSDRLEDLHFPFEQNHFRIAGLKTS
jgi:hypothetical protein